MGETLTTAQVAKEIQRTPRRVRQMAAEGRIPLQTEWSEHGPRLSISRADFEAWRQQTWEQDARRWWAKEMPT